MRHGEPDLRGYALWVPAGIAHRLRVVHRSALRILYAGERARLLSAGCRVLDVPADAALLLPTPSAFSAAFRTELGVPP